MGIYEIKLAKEDMKFSSAHFTIFEDFVERLHGHNYQVILQVKAQRLENGLLLDFGVLKQEARRLCTELDETLLLAGKHSDVKLKIADGEVELLCRGKRYVFPEEDCRILPVENVSCECLAAYFCHTLIERLRPSLREAGVLTLAAVVQESPGQSGRCEEALAGS